MAYVIAEPCYTTKDKACVPACPVQAIFPADELPEKWKFYAEVNKNFFPEKDEAKAWAGHTVPPEKEKH